MTFYVQVSQLDYDDYPLGSPTKIGPFETYKDAEKFLEASTQFRQQQEWGWPVWRYVPLIGAHHSVHVKELSFDLSSPERYM